LKRFGNHGFSERKFRARTFGCQKFLSALWLIKV
jgi:hypothetical protein